VTQTEGSHELVWQRPLRAGLLVAVSAESSGALGALVLERGTRRPLLLGADHVLRANNRSQRVWQPAPCGEHGCECNVVARVLRGKRSIVQWREHWYYIDAAVAALESDVEFVPSVVRAKRASAGLRVSKVGPATGTTTGIVADTNHVDNVRFGLIAGAVPNQILIRPHAPHESFAANGDSGALVCDESGCAIGLLWGADGWGRGVACPIGPVLEQLSIDFQEAA
jgi:hypothetical protein